MREEKPDVQGRCHRAESGNFNVKTEFFLLKKIQSTPGARYPYTTTTAHSNGRHEQMEFNLAVPFGPICVFMSPRCLMIS